MKCLGEKPFNGRKRPGRRPEAGGGAPALGSPYRRRAAAGAPQGTKFLQSHPLDHKIPR
jgi:hypothetical protein